MATSEDGRDRVHGSTAPVIRPAVLDEFERLVAIERSGDGLFVAAGHAEFADASTIAYDEAVAAIADGRLWVYEHEGEVVGWVSLEPVGDELGVHQISVDPAHGRRGIGTALMRHAMASSSAPTIVLDTQADVAWNAPWYRRLGFEDVSPDRWTPAMRRITEQQRAAGFDWSTRVHLRWRRPA